MLGNIYHGLENRDSNKQAQQFSVVNDFWMKKENLLIVVPIGQKPSSVFSVSMGFIKNNPLVWIKNVIRLWIYFICMKAGFLEDG